jgi:toxin-antitoxin system PIN domain toxin
MILVDANLLIYAHVKEFAEHSMAREWLDEQLNEQPRVGLPWPSLLAFMRITSNARVFERPLGIQAAWAQVEAWLGAPASWIPTPGAQHAAVFASLVPLISRPNLVPDAHLAALAIEHGLTLCSTDGDFARFKELRWKNPLVSQ